MYIIYINIKYNLNILPKKVPLAENKTVSVSKSMTCEA